MHGATLLVRFFISDEGLSTDWRGARANARMECRPGLGSNHSRLEFIHILNVKAPAHQHQTPTNNNPPHLHQDAAPAPNSTDLFVEELPGFTAFVATKGGYIFDGWRMSKMAEALVAAVAADGYNITSTAYTFATYDPPYQFFARHNEVWIEKP